MRVFIGAAIVLTTIAAMECVASVVHRHVMHGWGWGWHQSHHQKRGRGLEKNDLYAMVFAAPALGLIAIKSTRPSLLVRDRHHRLRPPLRPGA